MDTARGLRICRCSVSWWRINRHAGCWSRRNAASTSQGSSQFRRSEFLDHTAAKESWRRQPPLPRELKQYLDTFVVGQERAKKVLSVALFNHYQRVRDVERTTAIPQDEKVLRSPQRKVQNADASIGVPADASVVTKPEQDIVVDVQESATEPEVPDGSVTQNVSDGPNPRSVELAAQDTTLEKSNVLLLGPSGVGKTLMAKTLARVLAVPFSMSDCTPFTQAGYVGEDAEVCVHRLLAAADYDVAAAERGIICLDEIDKLSTTKSSQGKDVSGEGVQQALLKIIEGTTLHIQAKPAGNTALALTQAKAETFVVKTDNILFICTGAFNGLSKMVLNRVAKGGIGFNSTVRGASESLLGEKDSTIRVRRDSEEAKGFEKHVPFEEDASEERTYQSLDLVEPVDLEKYGMIPELIGRVPVVAALATLDEADLVRVLSEPRNSLLKQYQRLFHLSGIELHFSSAALQQVARSSLATGTGARGLRSVMEKLLTETMYEAPGTSIKYVLVTQDVVLRKKAPFYFPRGQQHLLHTAISADEQVSESTECSK